MKISLESTAARPSFSMTFTVIFDRSKGVKKSVSPPNGLAGSRGAVRASSSVCVAPWALVFQTLRPCTTKPSPRASARVSMREVSVPAFGSVTPKDITISPLAMSGSTRRLRASLPCLITGMGGNM